MHTRLRRLFAAPIFPNEEKTRTARILNIFSWISLGTLAMIILLRFLAGREAGNLALWILLGVVLVMVLVQIMLRLGYVRGASVFLVLASWSAMTYQAWIADGVRDVATIAHLPILLLAGLLLGWREGFVLGILSGAVFWFFAIHEMRGFLVSDVDAPLDFARDLTVIFLITGAVIYLFVNNLNHSLRDARLELKERLRADEKLQVQARYLTALHETTFGLVNRLELNPLLESILDRASQLLDTPHVGIDLLVADESALRQELGRGVFAPWNGTLTSKGVGLTGKVWEQGITILTENYKEYPYRNPDVEVEDIGFGAMMGAPINSGEKIVGSLLVAHVEKQNRFTAEQVILLERLAALASVAIDNARLYEKAQKEINERRIIEQDLRSSDERFRKVFNNNNIAISIVTLHEGIFLEANEAFWQLTGLSPEQALGHSSLDFNLWKNPSDRERFVRDLLEKGSLQNVEVEFPGKGQTPKPSIAYYELINIRDQRCILCMFYDVSEQRQAERALKESEERFRKVFHTSPVAICITTLEEGRLLEANDAYWKLTGYDLNTSLGRNMVELEAWSSIDERADFANELREKRSILNLNYEFLDHKTQSPRYAIALYEIIEIREQSCVLSMFYDVTEQKLAQDALQSAEARTRALLESIPDMIFEISKEGVFLDFMASAEISPLMPPEEFIGRNIRELFPPAIAEQTMFALERVLATGQLHAFEYGMPPGDETQFFEARVTAVTSESAIIMVRNISQRKWVETEREKLIQELEGKNSELERFTYTVSHDLKSPLITIKGFLGFLEQDAVSGNITRLREDTKRIADATDKMQVLLDELLELSRIGRLVNPHQDVPFDEIVREALELVHGRVHANSVEVHVQENLPTVHGDRRRLVEVLQNLIDNAAKFSGSHPNPLIEIGQTGYEDDKPIFFIRDNGMGIDPVHHERIFGLFNKLDANSEGTGVGLALVKRIVEVHGGRIWVQSEAGQGAAFFFTLQAKSDS